MKEKLKNLKVGKKLQKSFTTILTAFIIAIVIALAGIVMIKMNLERFYQESYANVQLQLEIRRELQMVDKNVLWAVTMTDKSQALEKINEAATYAQEMETNVQTLEQNFSDKEMTTALEAAFQALQAERLNVTDLVSVGKTEEALALFNGTYNNATLKIQDILVQIGEAADAQAATAYGRASSLITMLIGLLVIVGVISFVQCTRRAKVITSLLVEPIQELQNAAQKLKAGELNIDITYTSEDELGDLAQNFREACAQMQTVIEDEGYLLSEMAAGNFNVHTNANDSYVGDFGLLIESMRKLNRQLNHTLSQINAGAGQVMVGAGQLADSAQSLAEGATDQAGAVDKLTETVGNVSNIAEESAESAENAAVTAKNSAENAEKSREEINGLTGAMERITETSKEIENIIATIEDIASQTNLLSLNASIEAARAGEAGRGFAVVADQIGKLASDSAQSAVTTKELINKSLVEIENGNQLVAHTIEAINSVLESMEQFAKMASGVAESSKMQADMLKQVEAGIEQISSVVVSNSTYAEENSAISEELFAQAQTLEQMVAAFEFRNEE